MVSQKKKHQLHSPNRKYGIRMFYAGLLCIAAALFINSVYIRPTNFKHTFKQHQLSDCIANGTPKETCHKHFDN